jgi:UDP-N-acetylglucosamine 2-epimerase
MKVVTVVGARPQFIKAGPVGAALRDAGHEETLVHTGQHYDHQMSQVFFDELGIPAPHVNLNIGSGSHAAQTGRMLIGIEEVLLQRRPDWVLVYGDTNSTLAGALAACKLRIPLAHVESGLRSYNRDMPEEHNRVLTDHCADLLLCPTQTAVDNLRREGITAGVVNVGDTMYDAVRQHVETARRKSRILQSQGLTRGQYLLATLHRPYNVDDPQTLQRILSALVSLGETVVFPLHPRTRARIAEIPNSAELSRANLKLIDPVGYLDMLALQEGARVVITDSGGVQKEALFLSVPCVTLRPETEWVETVQCGWNTLVPHADADSIRAAVNMPRPRGPVPAVFGNGDAARRIVAAMACDSPVHSAPNAPVAAHG